MSGYFENCLQIHGLGWNSNAKNMESWWQELYEPVGDEILEGPPLAAWGWADDTRVQSPSPSIDVWDMFTPSEADPVVDVDVLVDMDAPVPTVSSGGLVLLQSGRTIIRGGRIVFHEAHPEAVTVAPCTQQKEKPAKSIQKEPRQTTIAFSSKKSIQKKPKRTIVSTESIQKKPKRTTSSRRKRYNPSTVGDLGIIIGTRRVTEHGTIDDVRMRVRKVCDQVGGVLKLLNHEWDGDLLGRERIALFGGKTNRRYPFLVDPFDLEEEFMFMMTCTIKPEPYDGLLEDLPNVLCDVARLREVSPCELWRDIENSTRCMCLSDLSRLAHPFLCAASVLLTHMALRRRPLSKTKGGLYCYWIGVAMHAASQ
jgi:hypothetical protein